MMYRMSIHYIGERANDELLLPVEQVCDKLNSLAKDGAAVRSVRIAPNVEIKEITVPDTKIKEEFEAADYARMKWKAATIMLAMTALFAVGMWLMAVNGLDG